MSTETTVIERATARPRILNGKVAPVLITVTTKTVSLVVVLAAFYIIAFFSAVRLVPLTMGFVMSGTGVTMDMPFETVLSVWIAPSLFLLALLFALVLVTMRQIWRLRRKLVHAVSAWALGREEVPAATAARNKRGTTSTHLRGTTRATQSA